MITTFSHRIHLWSKRVQSWPWKMPSLSHGGSVLLASSLLMTGVLTTVVQYTRWIEAPEITLFDWMVRQQAIADPDPRLVIAALSEQDVREYGPFLTDAELAQVIAILQEHDAAVIGVDFYRDVPKPPGTSALAAELQADNVIVIEEYNIVPPPPNVPPERVGFNNFAEDLDSIVRRNVLFASAEESNEHKHLYSFGLQLSLAYLNQLDPDRYTFRYDDEGLYIGDTFFPDIEPNSGGYSKTEAVAYQVLMRYRAPHYSDPGFINDPIGTTDISLGHGQVQPSLPVVAPEILISDLLRGQFNPEDIAGKVVLIGSTAASLKDDFGTPYRAGNYQTLAMSGVVMHAQATSQILSTVLDGQALYGYWPQWGEWLLILGCSLAGGGLTWYFARPTALGIVAIAGPGLIFVAGISGFLVTSVWLPITAPVLGFVLTGGLIMAYRLFYSSTHDRLTGLPNRDRFIQFIQAWLRYPSVNRTTATAVMFLDLDRFKAVNDSMGHTAGDQVLKITVDRLKLALGGQDSRLARVGGDEFAILLQVDAREAVTDFADQLQQEFMRPLQIQGRDISTPLSIGIAFTQEGYDHKAEDLLRDAHTAMYRAKALGKARHEVFATGMLTEVLNRIQLESDMRKGMEQREFSLNYQPIVSLKTGRIAGFEALARWFQHQRGSISPVAFIPVAEETGLIVPLGQWIFEEACTQARIWQTEFPDANLSMSINLSSRQFSQANLAEQLQQALVKTQVQGNHIKIEITESMVMGDVDSAIDLMLNLKSLNLHLGIDDFGTGYSSLSYLHRFPMDTLKVDRSFVSRMEESSEDYEIVRTIITLGHNLGMEIVAEGVETAAQVRMLRELNCEYGQGYFFARPLTAEAASALLRQDPQW